MTITLLLGIGAVILLTLLAEWLPPFWGRTVILLQGVALVVALLAYRWRPSKRLMVYPLLLAVVTYLWDQTLPPPSLIDGRERAVFPLAVIICIVGDLLVTWWHSLPFTPKRIPVYGRYVNLDEAAHFFRMPPDIVRVHLLKSDRAIVAGRSGEEYVTLDDIMAAVAMIQSEKQ
jgi:hypothetical protein